MEYGSWLYFWSKASEDSHFTHSLARFDKGKDMKMFSCENGKKLIIHIQNHPLKHISHHNHHHISKKNKN